MLFCSQQYLIFFTLIFAVYWLLPWHRARVWLLLGASFYFYASWNKWLAALICVTTAMDYVVALGMDWSPVPWKRKLLLGLSLVVNLSLLLYFKYANFFLDTLALALGKVGAQASLPVLSVILPVGISFYTFEAINYTIDVYRGRVRAERNLGNFMLFITFFPHLVAGPIVRARDFLPQTHRRKRWDWARLQLGAQFFLMGLFKKLAIADRMALYSQPVFQNPEYYGSGAIWLATLAFTLRIYCDFSGYTDMALGSAHMLGYKLAQNFNMPYISANVSEFWRRWHISLSSWLRDYLFIPLGGSRGSNWQTCRNLLITMTLGGLWHGISWMFVVWGLLHGLYLVIHRGFRAFCERRPRLDRLVQSIPGTALRISLTFVCVILGWVFFYTGSLEAEDSLKQASENAQAGARVHAATYHALPATMTILHRLVVSTPGMGPPLHNRSLWYTVVVMVLCHALAQRGLWKRIAVRLPAPALGFGYAVVLTLSLVLAPDSGKAFIYFQF
jgi:alginate O-acetyltransferase complex protein AlgI